MSAPPKLCCKQGLVAVLASGVAISLTALTGGVAPAFADPIAPTTSVSAPEPEVVAPEETTTAEAPPAQAPSTSPATLTAAPSRESPVQTQAPEPPPPSSTTVVTAVAPASPSAPVTTTADPTTDVSSVPTSAASRAVAPSGTSTTPPSGSDMPETVTQSSSTLSEAAPSIEPSAPQTLQASEQDVELAKTSKPQTLSPIPAPRQDIDALSNVIDLPNWNRAGQDKDARVTDGVFRGDNRDWDRKVRQWRRDWVQYDEYYRPVILNPYRNPVRIVYIYLNAPRIVVIPPLARIVVEAADFAAYSFTAVVLSAVNTPADVAVGSFIGGGYFPGIGVPLPPPPPPVLRYDNVPVLVRYSQAVYEPFRVRRIIDVGEDLRYGERKVLLDGATPAWGEWTQTSTGERQFEVHRTQQFPGLDDPQEAPLPGDYQLRLATDDASGPDRRGTYLTAAGGVVAALGFAAIVLSIAIGRQRPRH